MRQANIPNVRYEMEGVQFRRRNQTQSRRKNQRAQNHI
jgi:hypothetical protein